MSEFNAYQELDRRRMLNQRALAAREAEIYEKLPEIWQCTEKIRLLALRDARERLSGRSADSSQEREELRKRIDLLLKENGYPADYLSLHYTCPLCRDEGSVDGMVCSCVRQMKIEYLTKASRLVLKPGDSFADFDLSLYRNMPHPEGQASAEENMARHLKTAKEFVSHFGQEYDNLMIYGETGLGKTFLCNCIAREILAAGHSVLYLTANSLFREVFRPRRDSDEDETNELRELVYSADLLILDDLGTESLSEFVRSVLFEVINQRILDRKPVIISTNLDLKGIADRYTERLNSRIVENYRLMLLYGYNIRYAKKFKHLGKDVPHH